MLACWFTLFIKSNDGVRTGETKFLLFLSKASRVVYQRTPVRTLTHPKRSTPSTFSRKERAPLLNAPVPHLVSWKPKWAQTPESGFNETKLSSIGTRSLLPLRTLVHPFRHRNGSAEPSVVPNGKPTTLSWNLAPTLPQNPRHVSSLQFYLPLLQMVIRLPTLPICPSFHFPLLPSIPTSTNLNRGRPVRSSRTGLPKPASRFSKSMPLHQVTDEVPEKEKRKKLLVLALDEGVMGTAMPEEGEESRPLAIMSPP